MDDRQLLKQFVEENSEGAFRTLLERHLGLVLGTARRIAGASTIAEEVAQTVFLLLANKAGKLSCDTSLTGWLYRTTSFVATRALRSELRRTRREQEAVMMSVSNEPGTLWQQVGPKLDDAIARLSETDRSAILHRFFEQRSLRDVGTSLGVTEEAAKKRVARALEKLRRILLRRGADISAGALVAGLTCESSAMPPGVAAKLITATLAKLSTAEATGLLAEVLAAMRWAKIKLIGGAVIGVGIMALLAPKVAPLQSTPRTQPHNARNQPTVAAESTAVLPKFANAGIENLPHRTLRLTVLDEAAETPIHGADVTHTLMPWRKGEGPPAPIRTDANGVAELRIPEGLPEPIPVEQFQAFIRANAYAPRSVMWLSTTGGVLKIVTNDYTVRLERGITLSGAVVDDSGKPLVGVMVGTVGSNYRGYSISRDQDGKVTTAPEFRTEVIDTYSTLPSASGPNAIVTDYEGRFEMPHYPRRLQEVQLELVLPDGSRHRFRTPAGRRLSSEELPEVSLAELKSGTARITIPRGVLVEGTVVGSSGKPIADATVTESVLIGNLKILSRNRTDELGQFRLENRSPREVILSASAPGHAGLSQVVTIEPGMKALRLQLQPEQPLRGKVLDEFGQPISGARLELVDHLNDTLGFEWNGTTDAEGRFIWQGAPTNELLLAANASGFTTRYARLESALSNNLITLAQGLMESLRLIGSVTDLTSGKPIERFSLKVHDGSAGSLPEHLKHTVAGHDGAFEAFVPIAAFENGPMGGWVLQITADAYDPLMTRLYYVAEGDQHLELRLQPGGTLEGVVLAPGGAPAAGATFGIRQEGNGVLAHRDGELARALPERSDASGRFRFTRPLKATALVVFHDTGWGVAPLRPGRQELQIQLQPWAKIEGVLTQGGKPLAKEPIGLHMLAFVAEDSFQLLCGTTTDNDGRFVFNRVPEGEFNVHWQPRRWRIKDTPTLEVLEQIVVVRSGEVKKLRLGEQGATVRAKFQLPPGLAGLGCSNILALLSQGHPTPPPPNPAQYATHASLNAAIRNHHRDPATLAAKRSQRHFLGEVTSDGSVIFQDVPAGRYLLEAKLFDLAPHNRNSFGDMPVAAQLRISITVPDSEEADLDSFTLNPTN